jgi:hypothetical protein
MMEYATQTVLQDWQDYADLLLLAALAEADAAKGRPHLKAGLLLWDGKGFNDRVAKKSSHYATYKLALALWSLEERVIFELRLVGQANRLPVLHQRLAPRKRP